MLLLSPHVMYNSLRVLDCKDTPLIGQSGPHWLYISELPPPLGHRDENIATIAAIEPTCHVLNAVESMKAIEAYALTKITSP